MRETMTNHQMGLYQEVSILIGAGGASQSVAISTTSAQSAAITGDNAVLYSTADCFVRSDTNPTALADGTDHFLPANTYVRARFAAGNKLAFKTAAGTGTVYITPGA